MPFYRVVVQETTTKYAIIEADDEDTAREEALEADWREWKVDDGGFHESDIESITETSSGAEETR